MTTEIPHTCAAERHLVIDADAIYVIRCDRPARHGGKHGASRERVQWDGDDASNAPPWTVRATGGQAFGAFVATNTDDERLALGIDTLRAALAYARGQYAGNWASDIYEYVYAIESGKGLNRPL